MKRKCNTIYFMFNCNIYSVSWNIVITKVPLRIAHVVIILKIYLRERILLHIYMYIYACITLEIILR